MDEWILEIIRRAGHAGIVFLMVLENAVPMIPSELILPFAGFLAADGDMSLLAVIVSSSLGSTAGASGWYVVGRKWGRDGVLSFVRRRGKWLLLDVEDVKRAEHWFSRHKRRATFFGRLVPGIRSLISVPAGVTHMPAPQFLGYTLAGSTLWNAALVCAGYLLADAYHKAADAIGPIGTLVFAGVFVVLLVRHIRRQKSA